LFRLLKAIYRDTHHTAQVNGTPLSVQSLFPKIAVTICMKALLIQARTDKVSPIVKRKEYVGPTPTECR
jgi:hypothetical protein